MQESIVFLVRVQCRRKESSRLLSHLLMSFLYNNKEVKNASQKQLTVLTSCQTFSTSVLIA